MPEQVIGTERKYEGKIVNLRVDTVRFDNGDTAKREVVEHHGAVAMVPMPDNNHVILVTQYRTPTGKELLEIPAGTLNDGEEPLAAAHREIIEEINLRAGSMERLCGFYTAPGFSTEFLTVYLATSLTPEQGTPDADEFIKTRTVTLDEAMSLIDSGEIEDAKSVAGILAAARHLARAAAS